MDDRTVRRILILTVLAVWTFFMLLSAIVPDRKLPDGLMALMTVCLTGALGLPTASAVASALKRPHSDESGTGPAADPAKGDG